MTEPAAIHRPINMAGIHWVENGRKAAFNSGRPGFAVQVIATGEVLSQDGIRPATWSTRRTAQEIAGYALPWATVAIITREEHLMTTTTRKAITTQLRDYCAANGLTYDVTTASGPLRVIIDGEVLSPGDAADKYLTGGFDAAYGTTGEPPASRRIDLETAQRAIRIQAQLSPLARGALTTSREINGRRSLHPAGSVRTHNSLISRGIATPETATPDLPDNFLTDFGLLVHLALVKGADAVRALVGPKDDVEARRDAEALAEDRERALSAASPAMRQQPQQQHQAGPVATLFGTVPPAPITTPGLFDDTGELAVTADPARPAARRAAQRMPVDLPGTGGELFALELEEGTPETGFVFGLGDL